jgi:parallel beta-helix repeat protein
MNHAQIYNNFISNTHHEGIFLVGGIDSIISNNTIAGICSDCLRLDNCVRCEVSKNLCFSYSGNHNNGEWENGVRSLQVANGGVSHGYDARNQPTSTKDINVHDNVFANNGLKTILLDSVALSESANVIIQNNKFIGQDELIKIGIPFKLSEGEMPTKETSEDIFSSIFDILNTTISDTGYVDQSSVFNPDKTLMSKGTESAWIDIIGYTGEIRIGDNTYVPKPANESALVVSGTQTTRDRAVRSGINEKAHCER